MLCPRVDSGQTAIKVRRFFGNQNPRLMSVPTTPGRRATERDHDQRGRITRESEAERAYLAVLQKTQRNQKPQEPGPFLVESLTQHLRSCLSLGAGYFQLHARGVAAVRCQIMPWEFQQRIQVQRTSPFHPFLGVGDGSQGLKASPLKGKRLDSCTPRCEREVRTLGVRWPSPRIRAHIRRTHSRVCRHNSRLIQPVVVPRSC